VIRRASLPGAAELFRSTADVSDVRDLPDIPEQFDSRSAGNGTGSPSGRERHAEKITVYCSADELLALEAARLALRAKHGLAVDRGRIVREALAVVLADLHAKGDASILVRRLSSP
jgi:hypothetical protein